MSVIKSILSFARHYVKAKTLYQIHSPYVFDLLTFVLDHQREYYTFRRIETIRQQLLQSQETFNRTDYGAGSHSMKNSAVTVSKVARTSLSHASQCVELFRLAEFTGARRILEMGTSLGISTMYLASRKGTAELIALEGDPFLASHTSKLLSQVGLENWKVKEGIFSETLPILLAENPKFDLIFIDGHHEEKATIRYFETLAGKQDPDCVIVIDDIHWSDGMNAAWQHIKSHQQVTQSIELFAYGIVLFRKEFLEKENHIVVPVNWKPWKVLGSI